MPNLGTIIIAYRGLTRKTKAELARQVGCTEVYLYELETGRRKGKPAFRQRLANAMGVPLEALDIDQLYIIHILQHLKEAKEKEIAIQKQRGKEELSTGLHEEKAKD